MEQNVFVKANKLTKTFGQVKANDAVDFDYLKTKYMLYLVKMVQEKVL